MAETRTRMTAEELLRLPDNGMRRELIDGELVEMAPAGGEHGYVAGHAYYRVRQFIEQQGLGGAVFAAETGFRIGRDPDRVRAPDVAYVAEARLAGARVRGYPELAPDLAVEVVSPNDTAAEVHDKVADWLRVGVRLVWALYPTTRSAMVCTSDGAARILGPDDLISGDPVVPGFACRVADLFA
ncbi:MAG: Uma2 family endonuclease [Chloroflexi bacterium]|nr:Uma2 family endonuclease [Chloroflexota bacterium]